MLDHPLEKEGIKELKYILLNVGVNDLDEKDHTVVFDEMQKLIVLVRTKYPGIKIIIGEATPRNDPRDEEVKNYNGLLNDYTRDNADITIAIHENLRDPTWSMYYDSKHIHGQKIAKFAANIIRALKVSYKINDKSELFTGRKLHDNYKRSTYVPTTPFAHDDRLNNHRNFGNKNSVDSLKMKLGTLENHHPMQVPLFENETMKKMKNDLMLNLTNAIQRALGDEWT